MPFRLDCQPTHATSVIDISVALYLSDCVPLQQESRKMCSVTGFNWSERLKTSPTNALSFSRNLGELRYLELGKELQVLTYLDYDALIAFIEVKWGLQQTSLLMSLCQLNLGNFCTMYNRSSLVGSDMIVLSTCLLPPQLQFFNRRDLFSIICVSRAASTLASTNTTTIGYRDTNWSLPYLRVPLT